MALGRRLAGWSLFLVIAATLAFGGVTWKEAYDLVNNPRETRKVPSSTPADRGLKYTEAAVETADGLRLHGWFIPADGRATVMLVHGYKDDRSSMLGVAAILRRHGYGVLVASLRGHDINDGRLISFGLHERADLDAWFRYLRDRRDVSMQRIGLFGVSMGGAIGLLHASENKAIRAIIADGAFSSAADTIETSVKFFTGLPPFPFAPAIVYWMEWQIGGDSEDLDATRWIRKIAPRAVMLMQGGSDVVVSAESGRKLFDAASEPKELWFEPSLGHTEFLQKMPEEFERRVVGFFDRFLKGSP